MSQLPNTESHFRDALPVLKAAFDQGYVRGFEAGRSLGFLEGINALTPAVSDGLRHGSGECGKAMRSIRNLRASHED